MSGNKYGSQHRRNIEQLFAGPGPHVCWLCGDLIDTSLPKTDPMSKEGDHVKPVSKYPELRYDISNLRKSHRTCNRSRSNNDPSPGLTRTSRDWSRTWVERHELRKRNG